MAEMALGTLASNFIHSFILHSVNPCTVLNNLKDIELVILLIIYICNKYYTRVYLNVKPIKYKVYSSTKRNTKYISSGTCIAFLKLN